MKTRRELKSLAKTIGQNQGGYNSTISRGLPYYGLLRKKYPKHFVSFTQMHRRSAINGIEVEFSHDADGFIEFLICIGDVPKSMKRPTVGRKDHDMGYVRGNFAWQEQKENANESHKRNDLKKNFISVNASRCVFTKSQVSKIREFRDRKLDEGWKKSEVIRHVMSRTGKTLYSVKNVVLNLGYK